MAKFCGQCGRPLAEGEVCNCTAQSGAPRMRPEGGAQQGGQYQRTAQGQGYYGADPNAQYQDPYYGGQNYQGGPNGGMYGGGGYYGGYQQGQRTKEMEWLNSKKDALVGRTKNMFSEILPILKSPVNRVAALANSGSMAVGVEFIFTKMVVCILFLLIAIFKALAMANDITDGFGFNASEYVQVPYLQLILVVVILSLGIDFIRALIQKGITAAFGCGLSFPASVTIVGAGDMYQVLFVAIGGLLSILMLPLGAIVATIGFAISPFIEIAAYMFITEGNPDRKPYAYFVSVLLCVIASVIITTIVVTAGAASVIDSLEYLF